MRRLILALSLGTMAGLALAADERGGEAKRTLPPAATGAIDLVKDIQPILVRSCLSCHGPAKQSSGLRLDNGPDILKGGNTGPAVKPGDSAGSRLVHLVAGLDPELKMPPKGQPLSAEEIGKLRAWIDQGAKWPAGLTLVATGNSKPTHWAFVAPQRHAIPTLRRESQTSGAPSNPLDLFIRARLNKEGISRSPEADRATLIRRLSFDLIGLPPTPEEGDEFFNDSRPDAYERLVDRLLASPHYGERWGRHWLDLARYADSDGFEKDTGRPHAWRYRHWLIEALNRDLPFDQFTLEQLAGDLLPNATTEQKVATGFHRNTLTNKEGGVDQEQFRVEQVVDRVNTTAKAFLGVTLGCAQCHDHKYDPFSQREYYQLFAFFNSDTEVDVSAPLADEVEPYNRKKVDHDRRRGELQAAVVAYRKNQLAAAQVKWESDLKLSDLRAFPANITATLLIDSSKRTEQQTKELAGHYAKLDKRLAELTKAVAEHDKSAPKLSMAQTLAAGAPRKTHLMIRGDFLRPGVEVQPATPNALHAEGSRPASGAATRLQLAQWITDPSNPLTSRVIVNWVWQKHFGRGLVSTLEDFGTQGEKPSHPELLDWLATEFVRHGWSLKSLHRLIVTSATYRQSSKARPELVERDPLNVLLARQNRLRLEAETIRDNALAVSGLLARRIGGPSVRPPQPAGISELTYAGSARWVESSGADRHRRGLYTWFQRTSPYPMLMTFDSSDANVCAVRRERTNTPLQALTLLNDTVFVECAQALGHHLAAEKMDDCQRMELAFQVCLARGPSFQEKERMVLLFRSLKKMCEADPEAALKLAGPARSSQRDVAEVAAWVALARTMMNLDEFVTRE